MAHGIGDFSVKIYLMLIMIMSMSWLCSATNQNIPVGPYFISFDLGISPSPMVNPIEYSPDRDKKTYMIDIISECYESDETHSQGENFIILHIYDLYRVADVNSMEQILRGLFRDYNIITSFENFNETMIDGNKRAVKSVGIHPFGDRYYLLTYWPDANCSQDVCAGKINCIICCKSPRLFENLTSTLHVEL